MAQFFKRIKNLVGDTPKEEDEERGQHTPNKVEEVKMPEETELNDMFEKFLDDVGIFEETQRKNMSNFGTAKKWQLITQERQRVEENRNAGISPNKFVDILQKEISDIPMSTIVSLTMCLKLNPIHWVDEFLTKEGVPFLFLSLQKLLRKQCMTENDRKMIEEYIQCIKALANNNKALTIIMERKQSLHIIADTMPYLSNKLIIIPLEIFSAIALLSPSLTSVLYECIQRNNILQGFVDRLIASSTENNFKAWVLTLFNALIKGMDECEQTEFKVQYDLDIIVGNLAGRNKDIDNFSQELQTQIDTYFQLSNTVIVRNPFPARISSDTIDTKTKMLYDQISNFPNLTVAMDSILQHLSLIKFEGPDAINSWNLVSNYVKAVASVDHVQHDPVQLCVLSCERLLKYSQVQGVVMTKGASTGNILSGHFTPPSLIQSLSSSSLVLDKSKPQVMGPPSRPAPPPPSSTSSENLLADLPPPTSLPPPPPSTSSDNLLPSEVKNELEIIEVGDNKPKAERDIPSPSLSSDIPLSNSPSGDIPPPPMSGPLPPPPPMGGPPPPPSMGGPPPPPSGGPGGAISLIPKKKVITPSVKMRGFNWTKLPYARIKNSIWESLDDDHVQFDSQLLEQFFSQSSSAASASSAPISSDKSKAISLLDTKRSQNISIMLSRFKGMGLDELKEAIFTVNLQLLTFENSHSLYSFAPEKEEVDLVLEYTGDRSLLAKAEQYVLMTTDVTRYKERLYAISVIQSFDSKLSSCEIAINEMRLPVLEMRNSSKIREFLELVLAIGNYMNGNTMRGGAFGYKIDSLLKLVDVRSTSESGQTLLHFVIRTMQSSETYSHLLSLPSDVPSIDLSSHHNLKQTIADVNDLPPSLVKLKSEIEQVKDDDPLKSYFSYWETSVEKLKNVQSQLTLLQSDFKDLLFYYGEDDKSDYSDFFSIFISFFNKFSSTIDEMNKKQLELEKSKSKNNNNNTPFNPFAGAEGRGLLDNILGSMRSGQAFVS